MADKPLTIGELQQKIATDPRSLTLDELKAVQELEKLKLKKQDDSQKALPRDSARDSQYEKIHSVIFGDEAIQPDAEPTPPRKKKGRKQNAK